MPPETVTTPEDQPEAIQSFDNLVDPDVGTPLETPQQTPATEPTRPRQQGGKFGHQHAAELVRVARDFGFSDEEIAATSTEQLNSQCWRIHNQRERARSEIASARSIEPPRQQQAGAIQQEIQEPDDEQVLEQLRSEMGLDERLVKILKRAIEPRKEVGELKGKLKEISEREQQREQGRLGDMIDSAFEGLGKDYLGLFGEGSLSDIGESSAHGQRRMAIARQAGIQATDSARTIEKKIQAAVNLLYDPAITSRQTPPAAPRSPDPYQRVVGQQPPQGSKPTKEDWQQAGLNKPAGRKDEELPHGDERARRNLARRLNEPASNAEDQEILNGLLG